MLDGARQELKYSHDATIAWFRDRWICLWNANSIGLESQPGQRIYMSTSRDGRTWSAAELAFANPARSTNPVPCPKGCQWQPNLIVVRERLWAVWSQISRDEHFGCYVSRLDRPEGRWANRRLLWDGEPNPTALGRRWRLLPTQNPIRLRSGRILAPLNMLGPRAQDAPERLKGWSGIEKRNSVLYTDDEGLTWHVSPGTVQPERTWAQWEPTVWELADGTVMMVARSNHAVGRPAEALTWSRSVDQGATWEPCRAVPIETAVARMHVVPAGGDRFLMVHNDWHESQFVQSRYNLALFFTRGAGVDFVAGPGITAIEPMVTYPQAWLRGNGLAVAYTLGGHPSSIRVAHVSPLPDPGRYFLFPRTNVPPRPAPRRVGGALVFDGRQHVATRRVVETGRDQFSAGAWVRHESGVVLLDTRGGRPAGGFAWGMKQGARPLLFLFTPERDIMPKLRLESGVWTYLGITVDARQAQATFYVDDRHETVRFAGPPPHPLRGDTGHIGDRRSTRSSLYGLVGRLRHMALYPDARLGPREHAWLHNQFAPQVSRPLLGPAASPTAQPSLWLDPADEAAFRRDFALPAAPEHRVECVQDQGRAALRFTGDASAGVDLDANQRSRGDRVEFSFRCRIDRAAACTLCTVGDANHPARLVADAGRLWLRSAGQSEAVAPAPAGRWLDVLVATAGQETRVSVDCRSATVTHSPMATWLYIGEGYPRRPSASAGQFLVPVASVCSRVSRTPTP